MTKDEFIAGLLDAGFKRELKIFSDSCADVWLHNHISLMSCGCYDHGFVIPSHVKEYQRDYKYTQANLDELITAAKVYERLERV